MFDLVIYIALVLFGLCLGSFAGASVWRLRAKQLVEDKKQGEEVDAKELKQLKSLAGQKLSKDRSRCLHCSYALRWYDLIPVISWLTLRGRCRECRKPIGYLEPLIEVGLAAFFVLSYALWPVELVTNLDIAAFVVWLLAGIGLAILFAYDTKWFLLPDSINFTVIGLGFISAVLMVSASTDVFGSILNIIGSVGVLSGIYLILYLVSKGAWIGFGDIKLGLGLGLLLADWQLAVIALFFANFIGCLIVIPLMVTKKLTRTSRVPFGPLLIVGAIVAKLIGLYVVDFYTFGLI